MTGVLTALRDDRCPDCGATDFREGPRGGASVNIECTGCRARFNVAALQGEIVYAERIPRHGEGGAAWPPVILGKGDRVMVSYGGQTIAGTVSYATGGGIWLMIEFDGGQPPPLPILFREDGYASSDGVKVEIKPVVQ